MLVVDVRLEARMTAPFGAVSWEGLEDFPGRRYRIYSAPLGVERFVFIVSRQPPGAGSPLHAHDEAEEIYVLLSGQGEIQLGDDLLTAHPLDGFRAPPGVQHATRNPTDDDIYWLVMAAPLDEYVAVSDWYQPGVTSGVADGTTA